MILTTLIKRNLLLYFRNKQAVFFSFFAGLIIVFLYMFIGNTTDLAQTFPNADPNQLTALLYSFVFSGCLLTITFTSAGGLLNIVVRDRESGVYGDFFVSPAKRSQIGLGYLLSAYIVSVIMTTVSAIICYAYLVLLLSYNLTITAVLLTLAYILLYGAVGASFATLMVVVVVKTDGAYSGYVATMSAGVGFLAGVYIPLSQLGDSIAHILQALPFAQGAALFHQAMMPAAIEALTPSGTDAYQVLSNEFSLTLNVGSIELGTPLLIAIAFVWVVACCSILTKQMGRKIR